MASTGKTGRGFTLIELLVVVAIIAILAAVLAPAYLSAQHRTAQIKCLGKLSQLSRAILLYAADNGGKPPNAAGSAPELDWYGGTYGGFIWVNKGQLWPYVRNASMYVCQIDEHVPARDAWMVADQYHRPDVSAWAKHDFPLSYSMNGNLTNRVLDTVRRTRDVMLLIHESRETINDGAFKIDAGKGFDKAGKVHYDGTTIAYVDTHAAWRSAKELDEARANGDWIPTK